MTLRAEQYFQASANLLLGVAFVTLASTGKLDLASMIGFIVAYALYLRLTVQHGAVLLSAQRVSLFSKLYILVFVIDLMWLSRSFVDAALHLLLFIQVLKFFSEKKDKDYFYLIAIAFMELLAAAAMTISATFFFAFLIFLALVISTLVGFEIKRSQEALDPVAATKLKGAAPAVSSTPSGRRRIYATLAATSGILSLGIVGFAALIFFALPRVEGGFFSHLNSPTQSITGFSSTVQFGDVGSIKRNMALVMRIEPAGDLRNFMGVKWRGIALNAFERNAWFRILGSDGGELARDTGGNYRVPPDRLPSPHRLIRYKVVLEPVSTEALFAALHARTIQIKSRVRMDPAESFTMDYHPNSRIRYEVVSDIGVPPDLVLRRSSSEYPAEVVRGYLGLSAMDPRVRDLARQITQSASNNLDRARVVEQYLRQNFAYTLDVPPVGNENPVYRFLFVTKRGHCEYFASSMAIMLQALGIPSRVVNGFQTGEYNNIGHDFIVREADAHSWVEAFFPGYGWVPFDPTPSVAPPQRAAAWMAINHYLDAMELFWINWVVGYDSFRQVTLFQDLQQKTLSGKRWAEQAWIHFASLISKFLEETFFERQAIAGRSPSLRGLHWFVTIGVRVVLLGVLGITVSLLIRQRRHLRAPKREWAGQLFAEWLRALKRRGYVRRPSETPMEFSRLISDPQLRALSMELTEIYNTLRFKQGVLHPDQFQSFHTKLRTAIQSL